MLRMATSSWTLHGTLGQVWYEPDGQGGAINKGQSPNGAMALLDLPAYVAKDGIKVLEITHFHIPQTDDDYLAKLKQALDEAGVELANLLVDTGNLSNPDEAARQADIDMTKRWQQVAAKLGAKGTRIDCGLEPATPEAKARSASALQELADYGDSLGLTTTTENWRTTSQEPEDLLDIMAQVNRPLNLCVDFGNAAKTSNKYDTLAKLLPYATSLHCKGNFADGKLDEAEFQQCLSLVKAANFDGHIALIYDKYDAEWDKVLELKAAVARFFPQIEPVA